MKTLQRSEVVLNDKMWEFRRPVRRHLVATLVALVSISLAPATQALIMPPAMEGLTAIRIAAQGTGVFVGSSFTTSLLFNGSDELYYPMHMANFMISSTPTACSWGTIEPSRGTRHMWGCLQAFRFAMDSRQLFRAGPLISANAMPTWFGPLSVEEKKRALVEHVTRVVARLHEEEAHPSMDVFAWDVARDIVSFNGTVLFDKNLLRSAFIAARTGDPHAHLMLSESAIAVFSAKTIGLFELAREFLFSGVPITGVSIRVHLSIRASAQPKPNAAPQFEVTWYDDSPAIDPSDIPDHNETSANDPLTTDQTLGIVNPPVDFPPSVSDIKPGDVLPLPDKSNVQPEGEGLADTPADPSDKEEGLGSYDDVVRVDENGASSLGGGRRFSDQQPMGKGDERRRSADNPNLGHAIGTRSMEKFFDDVLGNMYRFYALGLYVFFTDVRIEIEDTGVVPLEQLLRAQADAYIALINVCMTMPRCRVFEFAGHTDKYTNGGHPYIFDESYKPKLVHEAIVDIFQRWRAHSRGLMSNGPTARGKPSMAYILVGIIQIAVIVLVLVGLVSLRLWFMRKMVEAQEEEEREANGGHVELYTITSAAAYPSRHHGSTARGDDEEEDEDEESSTPGTNAGGYQRVSTADEADSASSNGAAGNHGNSAAAGDGMVAMEIAAQPSNSVADTGGGGDGVAYSRVRADDDEDD